MKQTLQDQLAEAQKQTPKMILQTKITFKEGLIEKLKADSEKDLPFIDEIIAVTENELNNLKLQLKQAS